MCWAKLRAIFKPKSAFPHPEESANPLATLENTDIRQVLSKWLVDWGVPDKYYPFWMTVDITLVPDLRIWYNNQMMVVPAATWAGEKRMEVDPAWANPGILAHECCHIVWAELEEDERVLFAATYKLTMSDPLVKLVTGYNAGKDPAWRDAPWEIHADIYRYLGQKMPAQLRPYYPTLF